MKTAKILILILGLSAAAWAGWEGYRFVARTLAHSAEKTSRRRVVVMGFSSERGVGEMLHSFGHRVESILTQTFSKKQGAANLYAQFALYDKVAPGRAQPQEEVGDDQGLLAGHQDGAAAVEDHIIGELDLHKTVFPIPSIGT